MDKNSIFLLYDSVTDCRRPLSIWNDFNLAMGAAITFMGNENTGYVVVKETTVNVPKMIEKDKARVFKQGKVEYAQTPRGL